MLALLGPKNRSCSGGWGGVDRRQFLLAGSAGIAGLTLANLLRAEAAAGIGSSSRAVINIHLDGGPPHQDMIDLKPEAPVEIRGEFRPISTVIPGLQVGELMPRLAHLADRFAFLRSLVGSAGAHDAFQCQSGFAADNLRTIGGRPAFGAVITRLCGTAGDSAPAFVDLMQGRPQVRNSARPGFLGPTVNPFRPDLSGLFPRELEEGMKQELANQTSKHTIQLTLVNGLTPAVLQERTGLLMGFDQIRRDLDASHSMDAMDQFTRQAATILTSGRLAQAMDLGRESRKVVDGYTCESKSGDRFFTSEDGKSPRKFLLARRLIEAGVRCVSVSLSDFDTHTNNFGRMRQLLPILDHGLHALITDLEQRGMLQDVLVVVWGEFGRSPRINKDGGRDHWTEVSPALLAGGGLRTGQVIGSTDRLAARVTSRPVHFQDVFATLYRHFGIDSATTNLIDPNGRPQHLLEVGMPIRELI